MPKVASTPAGPGPKRPDLTAKLIASLKDLIAEGALVPGCKLPPERELAERFGVSRPSLRQALKVLEIMGVLSQRIGDGTYLNRDASAILGEPLDFLILMDGVSHHELFEVRLIVEPELAARAAQRATADDLGALRRALDLMKSCVSDRVRFVEQDVAFHAAIFKASGNRLGQLIFTVIHRALATSVATTAGLAEMGHALRFHKAIHAAIRERDPEEARRQMTEHLLDAREVLERAVAAQPAPALFDRIRPIIREGQRSPSGGT